MGCQGRDKDDGAACICVVDDDDAVRHAMLNLLEAAGYRAQGFASGEAFLAWPRPAGIGLALFDVKLGGIDGFTLRERCVARGLPFGAGIPLLFVSGHGERALEERAARAGAQAMLRKPVDPELLLAHVERALATQGNAGRAAQ